MRKGNEWWRHFWKWLLMESEGTFINRKWLEKKFKEFLEYTRTTPRWWERKDYVKEVET